jgi:hypothetical protein
MVGAELIIAPFRGLGVNLKLAPFMGLGVAFFFVILLSDYSGSCYYDVQCLNY